MTLYLSTFEVVGVPLLLGHVELGSISVAARECVDHGCRAQALGHDQDAYLFHARPRERDASYPLTRRKRGLATTQGARSLKKQGMPLEQILDSQAEDPRPRQDL